MRRAGITVDLAHDHVAVDVNVNAQLKVLGFRTGDRDGARLTCGGLIWRFHRRST